MPGKDRHDLPIDLLFSRSLHWQGNKVLFLGVAERLGASSPETATAALGHGFASTAEDSKEDLAEAKAHV